MSLPTKKTPNKVVIKVGLLGDPQIGKTTLMVKYIEDRYDEDYIETLGVNFMEKTIHLKNVDVDISIWDLGGQKDFSTLMPLVCSEAKVVLFAFDLTAKQSLYSVKTWYKEARKENKVFMPFLIGTKYDLFDGYDNTHKQQLTAQARKFAKKMHAPLIYCSSAKSINVAKIFQIIVIKVFNMSASKIEEFHKELTEPILEYTPVLGDNEAGDDDDEKTTEKKTKSGKKKHKDKGGDTEDGEKKKKKKKKKQPKE